MKSGTSARTAGLLIAAAVALVTAGVVIVVAVSSKSGSGSAPSTPPFGFDDENPAAPGGDEVVDVTDVTESLQNGQKGRAELYAKDDPNRIAAHLEWERFEPQPGGWIDLIQPRVWLYTKDGRTVYIRAEQATLKTPSLQQAPESGVLREAVVIKLFSEEDGGNGRAAVIDPETDVPGLMAVTDSLSFDMLLSELTTPDHVRVETTAVKAEWTGLTARFNQSKQSLEYARFESDGDVWVYPKAREEAEDARQRGDEDADTALTTAEAGDVEDAEVEDTETDAIETASGDVQTPSESVEAGGTETPRERRKRRRHERELAEAHKPQEQLYQAVFIDEVRVERGSVTLSADVMRVLMRTVDGKLPADAFGKKLAETDDTPRRIERRSAGRTGEDERAGKPTPHSLVAAMEERPAAYALYEPARVDAQSLAVVETCWPMAAMNVEPRTGGRPAPREIAGSAHAAGEHVAEPYRLYEPTGFESVMDVGTIEGSVFASSLWSIKPFASTSEDATEDTTVAGADRPEPRVNDPALPIHLTWSGVLEVVSIDPAQTPTDLAEADGVANHLAVRWIAEHDEPVLITESATGGWAECDTLDYHATTRTLALLGGERDRAAMKAWVEWPGTARGTFDALWVNLGTGVGHAEGAGELATTGERAERSPGAASGGPWVLTAAEREEAKAAPMDKRVTWREHADFALRTRKGWVGDGIEWAEFAGRVLARDERSSIAGETVRVDFEHEGARTPSRLAKLTVEGDAVALAEAVEAADATFTGSSPLVSAGEMRADRLEVEFATIDDARGRAETTPAFVWAQGNVSTGKDGDVVTGQTLEAELTRDPRGKVSVSRAEVLGSEDGTTAARIERSDGSVVTAQRVVAHAAKNTADVFGSPAMLEKDGARIFGDEISLRGEQRGEDGAELFVFGPGRFEMDRREDADSSSAGRTAVATWTKSMSYDDATGRLDCSGDAHVESWDGGLAVDTMVAERVYVDLATPAKTDHAAGDDRRVKRIEAVGSVLEEEGGVNAHVESRRYEVGAAGSANGTGETPVPQDGGDRSAETKRLVQLFYLEGPRIIADDETGTVSVPAAGRAVIVDRRDEAELERLESTDGRARGTQSVLAAGGSDAGAGSNASRGPSGTSKFVWAGSALFARGTGVLDLQDEVELINKPLGDEPAVRLTCSRLRATIVDAKTGIGADAENGSAGDGHAASLRSVEALGSIYTQQGGTSLTADRLFYDAPTDIIIAEATGDNRVSMSNAKQPTPIVARRLRWNLRTDEVKVFEPAGISMPR